MDRPAPVDDDPSAGARTGSDGTSARPAAPRRRSFADLTGERARVRYGVAVVATAAALGAALALAPLTRGNPFLFFFAAVMLSGWIAGAGPGALAIALSVAASACFLMPPYGVLALENGLSAARLGLFVLAATLINALNAARWRAIRRAEAALRLRDEFLAIAAHELKTPLTTLKLHIQRLARALRPAAHPDDAAPPQVPSAADLAATVATLDRQVVRLERLVEGLLDVTQIARGRLALELAQHDVAALAREVVASLEEAATRAGVTLTVEAPASAVARCDRPRLEQVVFNLVSNAIKYGPRAPVTVRVRATDRDVVIAVQDRGIGVATADAARIFEPFERAVSPRNYGGLGLGLYVAREIVAAHGGELAVESAGEGQGATFTVTLPRGA